MWVFLLILLAVFTGNSSFFGLLLLLGMFYWGREWFGGGSNSAKTSRNERRHNRNLVSIPRANPAMPRAQMPNTPYRRSVLMSDYEPVHAMMDTPLLEDIFDEPDFVQDAIMAAGLDPSQLSVLPLDLGLLVYSRGHDTPEIYRTSAVPDDADYVRPFVELGVPRGVSGRIRFEILDSNGDSIFVDEANHTLKRGDSPVVATSWLPIDEMHDMDGIWQLKISAGDLLLADHMFHWDHTPAASGLRAHIQEDGEISPQLQAALDQSKLQRVSLDELLADFDDEPSYYDEESARRQRR